MVKTMMKMQRLHHGAYQDSLFCWWFWSDRRWRRCPAARRRPVFTPTASRPVFTPAASRPSICFRYFFYQQNMFPKVFELLKTTAMLTDREFKLA